MAQVFNALTGPELKEVILAEIGRALDNTGEFSPHMTFPWLKYDFKVGILCYPKQGMEDEPGIVATGKGEAGELPTNEEAPAAATTIEIEVKDKVIDTPDQARIDANLPIPTTTAGASGVLVDKPVAPKPVAPPKDMFKKKN